MQIPDRLKALGARLGPFLAVAVLAGALGYYGGSRGNLSHVEDKYHGEEKVIEAKTTKIRVVARENTKTRRNKTVKRETYRPDGTLSSRTTSTTGETSIKTEVTHGNEDSAGTRTETRTLDRIKVSDTRRDWRVTALVGSQLVNPLKTGGNLFSANLLLAIAVERRIIGPFSAGLFVAGAVPFTAGASVVQRTAIYAGLTLSLDF